MDGFSKFTAWFFTEIIGVWFIWASYMAVKFLTEDAQGQKAAFSVLHNTQVGGFILIPIILTIVFSVVSAAIWAKAD